MPRVKYRDADVALMARMMRAEAEGEGQQGMLYVGNVIVNRAVASCLDFNDVRTIEQVIYQVQGGNYSLKLFKRQYVLPTSERNGKRLAKQNLDFGESIQQNTHSGTSIHMHHVPNMVWSAVYRTI